MCDEESKGRGSQASKLISYSGKNTLEAIDFRDVRLGDQPTVMRAYPVSSLAQTPQGRYEQLSEMMAAGMVDVEEARDLLDHPDITGKNKRRFAARNLIDRMLDEAMSSGKRSADLVNRYMDLPYAQRQSHLAYCEALFIEAPSDHVAALEEICGAIATEMANLQAEEAAKQAAAQAAMQPAQGQVPPPNMAPPPPLGMTG